MSKKVSSEGIKEGIIKIIDGEPYYHYKYTDYLYQELKKANKEIERLNNIIDELEKDLTKVLEDMYNSLVHIDGKGYYSASLVPLEDTLDKLKELKEGKENE